MKKEEIRKEFFKLKLVGHSFSQCKNILKATTGFDFSTRTLKRWSARLDRSNWELKDISTRPHTIHFKVDNTLKSQLIDLRN